MSPKKYRYKPLMIKGKPVEDPIILINNLSKSFKKILIEDVEGIIKNKPQFNFIQKLSTTGGCEIWVDGGVRYAENIIDLFVAGADSVVIGTKTLYSFKELVEAYKLSPNLILCIDYNKENGGVISHNKIIKSMGLNNLLLKSKNVGIENFILASENSISDINNIRESFSFLNKEEERGIQVFLTCTKKNRMEESLERLGWLGVKGVIINIENILTKSSTMGV